MIFAPSSEKEPSVAETLLPPHLASICRHSFRTTISNVIHVLGKKITDADSERYVARWKSAGRRIYRLLPAGLCKQFSSLLKICYGPQDFYTLTAQEKLAL